MSASSILQIKPLGFPWETIDPFLFCVYHDDAYPKANAQMGPDASLAGDLPHRAAGEGVAGRLPVAVAGRAGEAVVHRALVRMTELVRLERVLVRAPAAFQVVPDG